MRIGVDTGGTFTDFVWLAGDGRWRIHKQLSTPHDPSEAIMAGITVLAAPASAAVVHGSTVATNALLERRGARTALITTAGFADVLAIGRQNRPDIYALVPQKPEPLVPQPWRFEVNERVTAQGDILTPLDPAELDPIRRQIVDNQIESVAVCLLFSFLRPEHEQRIKEVIGNWPLVTTTSQLPITNNQLHVSLSSEILPEYREYERTAATVINAYVAPLMSRYLERLAAGLAPRPLTVMQSNGGVISAAMAGTQAARTALSGPAGGVVGARYVAAQAGFRDIITFDMGGTSTDVALCPGRLPTTVEGEIAGLPLRLPLIDIHTVGAGGGSLAYVDPAGALHVGPQSAGADPGPACYGRRTTNDERRMTNDQRRTTNDERPTANTTRNTQHAIRNTLLPATTTDANLVLGRLDSDHFLGGTMRLEETLAREALAQLVQPMQVESVETAAWGVIQLANATMERAIRRISVERGYDPRRFTLLAFGGAGPLHACELAQNLQIPRVMIAAVPGVLSALGMLTAAPTRDYSQTIMAHIGIEQSSSEQAQFARQMAAQFEPLAARAQAEMQAEGHDPAQIELRYALDMRYAGQSHELTIAVGEPAVSSNQSAVISNQLAVTTPSSIVRRLSSIVASFHEAHERRYGYRQEGAAVEIVTIRLMAVAGVSTPPLSPLEPGTVAVATAVIGQKTVWFQQGPLPTRLYDRERLQPGHRFQGPAVVFQYDTTTVIPPEWEAAVDLFGNMVLTRF
jgi:N-methylhydantoinase A